MMLRMSFAGAAFALSAVAAQAVTVDFTDLATWGVGVTSATVGGVTVSVTATGGALVQTSFDPIGPFGGLAGGSDGLGVNGDEISPNQSITVSFSQNVLISGLYFLDLFPGLGQFESAIATFSTGTVVETLATGQAYGYAFNGGFAPMLASSVTFTVGTGHDSDDVTDAALAGLDFEIAPVPLPASALLLIGAVACMSLLRRRTV